MPNIYSGSTAISKVYLGATSVTKVYLGSTQIWVTGSSAPPAPMGVSLPSDYDGPEDVWYVIPGWNAKSGWPDTVLTSNKIDLPAGDYKVTTRIIHGSLYNTFGVRLKDAGGNVLVQKLDQYYNVYDLVNTSFTHPGGLVTIEIYSNFEFNSSSIIKAGSFVQIQPAALPTLQGMTKSGTQTLANSPTPVQITGWAVDPNYPGTTITSNSYTIVGSGPVKINAQLTSSTTNSGTWTMHIRKNGVQISPTYENNTGGTGAGAAFTDPFGGTFTTVLQNGDVITMWAKTQASTSNRRLIDATTTWLNMSPATNNVTVYGLERTATFGPVPDSASYTRVDAGWAVMTGFTTADLAGGGITLPAGTYEFTARTEYLDYSTLTTPNARLVDASGNVLASWSSTGMAGNFNGNITVPAGKVYLELAVQSSFVDRRTLGTGSVMLFTKN